MRSEIKFSNKTILKLFIIVDVRARIRKASVVDTDKILSYCSLQREALFKRCVLEHLKQNHRQVLHIQTHLSSRNWSELSQP